jgi:hypothetical protein
MTTANAWHLKLIDTNDGTGDAIMELPDDLLQVLDCSVGDELSLAKNNQRITVIKKFGMAVDRQTNKRLRYIELYQMPQFDYLQHVIDGVSSQSIPDLVFDMGISQSSICKMLGLSPSTISRKVSAGQCLSTTEGELVLGIAKLIGQLQVMVEEYGDPEGFNPATWLISWVQAPLPAIRDEKPAKYLRSINGQQFLSTMMAKAIHAYV